MRGFGVLASSILVAGLGAGPAFADQIYNDIAFGDVNGGPEVTSYSGAANETGNSFGSVIDPTSTGAFNNVVLMMSNYATAAQYASEAAVSPNGYNVNMDLQVYQITGNGTGNAPNTLYTAGVDYGAPIYDSGAQSFTIGWRPPASAGAIAGGCIPPNSDAYLASNGAYSCGQLNALDFNMQGVLNQGASYLWVATILNSSDPAAQSLNWAINNLTSNISPASNPQYGTNYLGFNGVVVGSLVEASDETPWGSIGQGEIAFVPEPATLGLIGLGLLGIGLSVRRKSNRN